jgi:hypothetical protein
MRHLHSAVESLNLRYVEEFESGDYVSGVSTVNP